MMKQPGPPRRVVVTGLGMLSPVGLSVSSSWRALVAGESGIGPITAFDATGYPCRVAGEVKGFDPAAHDIEPRQARRLDRVVQLALAAALEAIKDARLALPLEAGDRAGVLIGSGMGGILTIVDQLDALRQRGPGRVSPFCVPMAIADTAAGQVSLVTGARGLNFAVVSACATGGHAIGEAAAAIKRGAADLMIAGGSEAAITGITIAGFAAARALTSRSDDPPRASRPFDRDRDGFVMGEGAGVLVLEELENARRRGARIYGEVAGYGATADAYHPTAPPENGEGAARCMRQALTSAGVSPSAVDYLNAHGTGTPLNDRAETVAIHAAFGQHARTLAVSSTKGMIGHLLGAAGAVEAVICLKAIETGIIPPTINYDHPDPDCDLDYTPNEARRRPVQTAMTNSFGFGGHNATLLFRTVDR